MISDAAEGPALRSVSASFDGPSASAVLDMEALRAFAAIADRGGVTAAAHTVGRTPAAVSMQLKKLEEMVGRTLFVRSGKGMKLTADGARLLGYARRLLGLQCDALAALRAPAMRGAVRLGLSDDYGPVALSDVLAGFAETHQEVSVSVSIAPTQDLAPRIDAGALDFALITPGCGVDWRADDALVHEEPLVWLGRRGGRAHLQDPVPVAMATSGCAWRRAAEEALGRSGRQFREAYSADISMAQRAAVAADLAIAPLPLSMARAGFEILGEKEGLPPIGHSRVALRWAKGARSAAAEALADRLRRAYALS